jgi:hypothetical protein
MDSGKEVNSLVFFPLKRSDVFPYWPTIPSTGCSGGGPLVHAPRWFY